MIDRENVIKKLSELHGSKETMEIIEQAIVLLKEQEVKQVVRKQGKRENSDGSIDYFAEWYCPHCGKLFNRGFDMPWIEYCYKCGKPVLWQGRGIWNE